MNFTIQGNKSMIVIFLGLFLVFGELCAQEKITSQYQNGVEKFYGIDGDQLAPEEWQANWIWMNGQSSATNEIMLARKSFELDALPDAGMLYVTGDQHYRLWINGKYINRGPARCDAHHQAFDIMDVRNVLKVGKNVIAAKVHHRGDSASYHNEPKPGLLLQLELKTGSEKRFINSDESWKVSPEWAWDPNTKRINYCNRTVTEIFDFRKYQEGWNSTEFEDSNWKNATLVNHTQCWPPRERWAARMPPWLSLVPRDIPYLEEDRREVKAVIETGEFVLHTQQELNFAAQSYPIASIMQHQVLPVNRNTIENLEEFFSNGTPIKVLNSYPKEVLSPDPMMGTLIVFDLGRFYQGYPELELTAPEGYTIEVGYAPFLIEGKFNPILTWGQYGDKIILPGGDTSWQGQEIKAFRYMGLYIIGTGEDPEPVSISHVGINEFSYPFESKSRVEFSDDILTRLWNAADKTLDLLTHENYNDSYQEFRPYIQTSWYAARCNYAIYNDPYIMRRMLIQHAQNQQPNGVLPMFAPDHPQGHNFPGILESDLFWQMSLYDYYMQTADKETVKSLLINLKRNLLAFDELENRDGLIENPPYTYWIDWTTLNREGASLTLNGWYMITLEQNAKLFEWLGHDEEARNCSKKAIRLREALKSKFWDDNKGLFVEALVNGEQVKTYDEISNGLALITGLADPAKEQSIARKIADNDKTGDLVKANLLMYWPVEGLFKAGFGDEALEILKRRYAPILQHPEGTIWEQWNLTATFEGGYWSARTWGIVQPEPIYQPDVFKRHLLGVDIIEPGMSVLSISAPRTGLKSATGGVPTPFGPIDVRWQNEEDPSCKVMIPSGVTLQINLDDRFKKISVNGSISNTFMLSGPGKYDISFMN
jgi:alpha-L-rhamnosidase